MALIFSFAAPCSWSGSDSLGPLENQLGGGFERRANKRIQSSAIPANLVRLQDHSLCNNEGPFPGLGASYFQALRDAKYDRPRDLRGFTTYLADRTPVLVATTSNDDTSNQGIIALYAGSVADLATVHFSRDTRTSEGGWLPVRDCYRAARLAGVPPVLSNEPIDPGSSAAAENAPIKLCSAAAFAYLANLPGYVFHSRTGIYGHENCCPPSGTRVLFEVTPGTDAFCHLRQILPPDLASWTRNDGIESRAPFTVFCSGKPNQYWPDARQPADGCVRNIGSSKGSEFVCLPMGILDGGVTLEA